MARNRIIAYRPDLKEKARKLRRSGTRGERRLWVKISRKQAGCEFHRQVPILDYIVDFYCHELHLAIEIDGSSHRDPEQGRVDITRESRLRDAGVTIIRFSEQEACRETGRVAQAITMAVEDIKNAGGCD
jgi:very-short-patch-repair endonuclease